MCPKCVPELNPAPVSLGPGHYTLNDSRSRDLCVKFNGLHDLYVTECFDGGQNMGWAILVPKPPEMCYDCGEGVETHFVRGNCKVMVNVP